MSRLLWATVLAGVALGAPARADSTEKEWTGGFRMEGDPKIETVFGDTAQFKRYVDRFFVLHAEMQRAHEDFSRNVQAVIASLGAHRAAGGGRRCPVDAVALGYGRAFRQGQTFHKLGKEIEANYVSIQQLDRLGETTGLTPDYRWKVSRALKLYAGILVDFREMKLAFQNQLSSELAYQGCDPQVLIAKGDELEKAGAPPTPEILHEPDKKKPLKKGQKDPGPPITASAATFFVDNSSCKTSLRVYLDGALLGEVGSTAKAAFRSLVGRHDMCLIPSTSQQQCGDPGTLRRTYIHDGWSITLRCD
jgi:hypothetical protein